MIKIKYILVCLLLIASFGLNAQNIAKVNSPNGNLMVSVTTENGKPYYEVSLNGKQFLTKSPLGLKTNVADLSEGLNMSSNSKKLFRLIF